MYKPLLALTLACLCVLGCSDRPLSSAEFTKEYAKRLQSAAPQMKVTIKADMELIVVDAAGKETTTFLDNSFKTYQATPHEKETILAHYVNSFIESREEKDPLNPKSITPIIKDKAWIAEVTQSLASKAAKPPELVYENLNPELIILYAEDSPNSLKYLTPTQVSSAKLDQPHLRELATDNLRASLTDIQINGENGFYMITAGGTYEASLLLLDELWQGDRMKVDGDYVVAIPSRDILLVTGSNNQPALSKLRSMAQKIRKESAYYLTSDLFVYHTGKFIRLEQTD